MKNILFLAISSFMCCTLFSERVRCEKCSGRGYVTAFKSGKCPRCNGSKQIINPNYLTRDGRIHHSITRQQSKYIRCPECSTLNYKPPKERIEKNVRYVTVQV